MKIRLDRTLCDGFGMCAEYAPQTFSVDEWGYVSLAAGKSDVLIDEEDGVRRALLDCPVHAIIDITSKA